LGDLGFKTTWNAFVEVGKVDPK